MQRRRLDPVAGGLAAVFGLLVALCTWHLVESLVGDAQPWMSVIYVCAMVLFLAGALAHLNDAFPLTVISESGIRRRGLLTLRRTSWSGRQWRLSWGRIRSVEVIHAYHRPYLLVTPLSAGPTSMSTRFLSSIEPTAGAVASPVTDDLVSRLPTLVRGKVPGPLRTDRTGGS